MYELPIIVHNMCILCFTARYVKLVTGGMERAELIIKVGVKIVVSTLSLVYE